MPDETSARRRASWYLDFAGVVLATALLIWPLFTVEYLRNWGSIESAFIAEARMVKEEFPNRRWLWSQYCGTRSDYFYPPGLIYSTAALAQTFRISEARGYHIYIATVYALGIGGVYLLVRAGSGSRAWAWIAAAGVALLSPSIPIYMEWREDALRFAPQRLAVLITYGEGPHMSALAILGFALAASLQAFRRPRLHWIALAAFASALVVTNNFYGATALALLFPLLWSNAVGRGNVVRQTTTAAAIALLAYGLTACWLVPSYFKITGRNLKLVAPPSDAVSIAIFALLVFGYAVVVWWRARRETNDAASDYARFVFGGLLVMAAYVIGYRYFQLRVTGDAHRLIPELELFIVLASVEALRRVWNAKQSMRVAVVLVVIASFATSIGYLAHAHQAFSEEREWKSRVEYRVATWMRENMPHARALVTGSVRFWYNVWYTLPEVDGGSQQGMLNEVLPRALSTFVNSTDLDFIALWLRAFAVDVAVVPEASSTDWYHDVKEPEKWREAFPIIRDDGEGNVFYRIPRQQSGIVRSVDAASMSQLRRITPGDIEALRAYVDAIEAPQPGIASAHRLTSDHLRVETELAPNQLLLLSESYDRNWRAQENGRAISTRPDALGFTLLDAGPGKHTIDLQFMQPMEARVGSWVSLLSLGIVAVGVASGLRRQETAHNAS